MEKESQILQGCLSYLKARGIMHWRNSTGAVKAQSGYWLHYGRKGSSDIIGVLPNGRALFVECKAPKGGRLSKEQKEFIDEARKNGALCVIAKHWTEIDAVLIDEGFSMNDMVLFNRGNK